jgi:hypothetical protein
MHPCPHCGTSRKKTNEYLPPTCGNSTCQESELQSNRERNKERRGSRRRKGG